MPGVPPDAVDNVKKLFKGLFKRGKKKQDKPAEQAAPTTSTQQPSNAPATQQTPAATNGGAPNTDKPLPPTLPQESGAQGEIKKDDVPQTQTAQAGVVESSQEAKKVPESQTVSPTSATPAAASEPVSAIEKSTPPAPPPKNEGDSVAPKTADIAKHVETTAGKENVAPPAPATNAETTPTPAATAPAQPNGTAEEVKKVDPAADGENAAKTAADEKVPVNEEPPAVKPASNAPGMSATSGPLEDFPEGGVHQ